MSNTRKVAWNTSVQIIGKFFSIILSLTFIGIIGRLLGVEGVGEYTTVLAFLGMLTVFSDFGFNIIMIRELTLKKYSDEEVAGNITLLRFLLATIVYTIGIAVGQYLNYPDIVKLGFIIVGIGQFMMTMQTMLAGLFQAKYQMGKSVSADILGKAILVAGVWYVSLRGGGVESVFWVTSIGSLITIVISSYLANKMIRLRFRFNPTYWKYLFTEALPLGINTIFHFLYFKTDTLILSLIKSSFEVGIYGIPYKILEVLLAIPGFFISSVLPVLTKYYKDKDPRIEGAFQKSLNFLILLAMPVVIGGITLAKPLIGIAGADFINASTTTAFGVAITPIVVLRILLIGTGFSYISYIFIAYLLAIGQQKKLILPNVFFAIGNISANLILIPKYSYLAAASITTITELVIFIVALKIAHGFIDFKIKWNAITKALIASLIMAILLIIIPGESLFIEVPSAVLCYSALIFKFKLMDSKTIKEVFKK